jgi:hypothetical protein
MRSIVLDAIVMTFATVRAVGRTIPGIEEGTSYGGPALVHRGQLVACIATNKQAEPNTLAVRMDFADRDLLIEEDPETYYLKGHYLDYPCVLVRLSRVKRDALHDLLSGALRFVESRVAKKRARASSGAKGGRKTRRSSVRSRTRSGR